MRYLHNLTLTVFCRPDEEDEALLRDKLRAFFPFDLEKEKIKINVQRASGYDNRPIHVMSVTLAREAHLAQFLKAMVAGLKPEQKQTLIKEAESRLDADLFFYIRFDKEQWNAHNELWIVDHGNCYHCKLLIAAYPKKRAVALGIIKTIFAVALPMP